MKLSKVLVFLFQLMVFIAMVTFFARENFSFMVDFGLIVGCVLAMILVTIAGRKVLDANTARISGITMTVQAFRISLYGIAITRAIKTADSWNMGLFIPIPESIGLAILIITGMALAFTFLNLAIGGLGAPAFSESVKLAKDWLYGKTRNPMVLAVFAWLISWGIYLQSGAFVLWVVIFVIPVEVFFEKHYEERELEIRFGESYLRYKAITPFMFPEVFPQFFGKVSSAVGKLTMLTLVFWLAIGINFAYSANWKEIPFSKGGAFIDTDSVVKHGEILSFWFLSKKVKLSEQDTFAQSLEKRPDAWMHQGMPFAMSIRKVEVDMSKTPRVTRSAFAKYFDVDGREVGTESEKGNWVPESGPRLWADLLWSFFGKERDNNTNTEIPTLLANK